MNILVRRTGALGDVVLATPVVRRLRRENPDARIAVCTAYAEVFRDCPWNIELRHPATIGLRDEDFDRFTDLNLAYERWPTMHVVDAYMLVAFGDHGTPEDRIPKMFPSQSVRLPDNAVAVHATVAGWANRTLPRETWLAVVGRLQERGLFPVLVGTERDALPGVRCTAFHSSDLQAQAAVIKACRAFVGSDSGLLHVAAAVGTPAVGVFTCADPDLRLTRPGDLAVTSGIDCEFCLHRRAPPATTEACERGDSLCVRLVDPAAIVRRVMERIG